MTSLERAIAIAVEAHAGQVQKNGDPYVLHPLYLMLQLHNHTERIVAVLHDVVEDSEWTLDDLQDEGFEEEVLVAVALLTHQRGMSYEQYIEELALNPIARAVKLADLEHNMDVRRLPEVTERDAERLVRYRAAWQRLKAAE